MQSVTGAEHLVEMGRDIGLGRYVAGSAFEFDDNACFTRDAWVADWLVNLKTFGRGLGA